MPVEGVINYTKWTQRNGVKFIVKTVNTCGYEYKACIRLVCACCCFLFPFKRIGRKAVIRKVHLKGWKGSVRSLFILNPSRSLDDRFISAPSSRRLLPRFFKGRKKPLKEEREKEKKNWRFNEKRASSMPRRRFRLEWNSDFRMCHKVLRLPLQSVAPTPPPTSDPVSFLAKKTDIILRRR